MYQSTKAYKEGYDAGFAYYQDDDFGKSNNPYKIDSIDWRNWNLGWNDGADGGVGI